MVPPVPWTGKIGGLIAKIIAAGEFKGELNETAVIHVGNGAPFAKSSSLVSASRRSLTPSGSARVSATAVRVAAKGNVNKVATIVHGAGASASWTSRPAAQAVAEGAVFGQYSYNKYKSKNDDNPGGEPVELGIIEMDGDKVSTIEQAAARGVILAESTNFARDLVNAPGNELTPAELAEQARAMAEENGLECEVLDRDAMERLGMGALLGVAKGSVHEPKLVFMRYRGSDDEQPIALVGKGVTFDTGGISLKPSAGMAAMTSDMAGAAAVLGAMRAIARLKPKQHVICVAACVENMPSGTALKPGDVVRAMTGKTIEIDNTDAEGRLILADAVAYAEKQGAHTIIDVATLTGACVIALGKLYTGLMSNDDELADAIMAAGKKAGERYCRLPADPDYKQQYKSDIADIKNTGGREAGTITGGLIISEFVDKARWAHLDIAGTSTNANARHYMVKGATGVAVRTLAEYVAGL